MLSLNRRFLLGPIFAVSAILTGLTFSSFSPAAYSADEDHPYFKLLGFKQAGASSLTVTTTASRVFTVEELKAAETNGTISALINGAVKSYTTLVFPAGVFKLPRTLFISGVNNVLLKGATNANGTPATTFNFTKSLTDLYGNNTATYGSFGAWHGGGGLITVGKKHPQYNEGKNSGSSKVGIENIIISFNRASFNGSREAGYNGIFFNNATESYVKNSYVINFDNAVILSGSKKVTGSDLILNAQKGGHFGIVIVGGGYNLMQRINGISGISHDLSVQKTNNNVFRDSSFADGAYDGISFRGGNYGHLFVRVNVKDPAISTSNGMGKLDPAAYGRDTYYLNCISENKPLTQVRVPSVLRNYIHADYQP